MYNEGDIVRFNGAVFPYLKPLYGEMSKAPLPLEKAVEETFTISGQSFTYLKIPEELRPYPKLDGNNNIGMCLGCGHLGIDFALAEALWELQIPPWYISVTSGIGCSGKVSSTILSPDSYFDPYRAHVIHGHAPAHGTGFGLVQPGAVNMIGGGDGDLGAIGIGQFNNIMNSGLNAVVFSMTNEVYGLTKGQAAPPAPLGYRAKRMSSPSESPSLDLALEAMTLKGTSFVARYLSSNRKEMAKYFMAAILHPGTAFIEFISPCVTWNREHDVGHWKDLILPIDTAKMLDLAGPFVDVSKDEAAITEEGQKIRYDPTDRTLATFMYRRMSETKGENNESRIPVGLLFYSKVPYVLQEHLKLSTEKPIGSLPESELKKTRNREALKVLLG